MALLKKVVQNGKGLIGITEEGEEIPVAEKRWGHVWRSENGTSLYGLFQINLHKDYRSEVERSLKRAKGYYIIGSTIRENNRSIINYVEYQPYLKSVSS